LDLNARPDLEFMFLSATAAIFLLKAVALVIGYLVIRLGYQAIIRGVKGEFDFQGRIHSDVEMKLVGSSPGLFFTLLGTIIICWALFVDKPVSLDGSGAVDKTASSQELDSSRAERSEQFRPAIDPPKDRM